MIYYIPANYNISCGKQSFGLWRRATEIMAEQIATASFAITAALSSIAELLAELLESLVCGDSYQLL